MTIIWYMVPEIWSATDRIFCHSGPSFALLHPLPYRPRKSKFWKNEKKPWRYYHFINVYHEWQSHDLWFLRYGVQRTEFSKNQNIEKMKKLPGDSNILNMCTTNDNHMMYCFWDIERDKQIFCQSGPFFALLPP